MRLEGDSLYFSCEEPSSRAAQVSLADWNNRLREVETYLRRLVSEGAANLSEIERELVNKDLSPQTKIVLQAAHTAERNAQAERESRVRNFPQEYASLQELLRSKACLDIGLPAVRNALSEGQREALEQAIDLGTLALSSLPQPATVTSGALPDESSQRELTLVDPSVEHEALNTIFGVKIKGLSLTFSEAIAWSRDSYYFVFQDGKHVTDLNKLTSGKPVCLIHHLTSTSAAFRVNYQWDRLIQDVRPGVLRFTSFKPRRTDVLDAFAPWFDAPPVTGEPELAFDHDGIGMSHLDYRNGSGPDNSARLVCGFLPPIGRFQSRASQNTVFALLDRKPQKNESPLIFSFLDLRETLPPSVEASFISR